MEDAGSISYEPPTKPLSGVFKPGVTPIAGLCLTRVQSLIDSSSPDPSSEIFSPVTGYMHSFPDCRQLVLFTVSFLSRGRHLDRRRCHWKGLHSGCMCNSSANAAHRRFMHSPKGLPLIAPHVSLLAGLTSGLAPAVEFSLSLFGRSHGARFVYSDFSARPLILSVEELE